MTYLSKFYKYLLVVNGISERCSYSGSSWLFADINIEIAIA
ncbi:hypothetical protein [uncultured Nostoc sp.]